MKKLSDYYKLHKKALLDAAGAVLAVVLLYVFFHFTGIGCPIHFLTGVSCPGCGMTRAVFALLRFRFAEACHYHPLVYVLPFAVLYLLFRRRIPKLLDKISIFTIVVLFVTIYVIRICDPANGVLEFAPQNGFLYRAFTFIFRQ